MYFKNIRDSRGSLLPIEYKDLPFIPKRTFIVDKVPLGFRRGCHAHYKNEQFLICLQGKIRVGLHNGKNLKETILFPRNGILVKNLVWDYQDFLIENSTLLVFCSFPYYKKDYITDFNKFKKITATVDI